MGTAVSDAMRAGGVKIPLTKRIWTWLNDKGARSNTEVASEFGIKEQYASVTLADLMTRNMVTKEKRETVVKGKPTFRTFYSANTSMHGVYELLPIVPRDKRQPVAILSPTGSMAVIYEPYRFDPKKIVENMGLLEARELYYGQLKPMFQTQQVHRSQ